MVTPIIKQTDSLIYLENNESKNWDANSSQLKKTYEAASRMAYGKEDYEGAAKIIDTTLKIVKNPDNLELFKILLIRAYVASKLDDSTLLHSLKLEMNELLNHLDSSKITNEIRQLRELE